MIHTYRFAAKRTVLLLLIISLICLSCKGSYSQEDSIKTIAINELGKEYAIDFNEVKTFALCQQKRIYDHPDRVLKYIVIDVSNKKIIQRGNFQSGYVKWISNDSIEVASSDKSSPDLIKQIISINANQQ